MTKNNLIAELCQNHKGSVSLLKEMIVAAKESGIKYLKIQDIKSEELTHRIRFDKGLVKDKKISVIKRPYKDELLRLKKLDLPEKFIDIFIEECLRSKIYPIVTPFTYSSLDRIKNKKFKFLKIASYDCSAFPFIKETSSLNKKLIVSTGATKLKEIKETVNFLKRKKQLAALLHCVSIYPTPMDKCNLNKIRLLKKIYGNIKIGWSDHSKFQDCGHAPALASIIVGGSFIERHFTIVRKDKTKDGPVSINPKEAKTLLGLINKKKSHILDYLNKNYKDWELCLGRGSHKLTHEELLNRDYYRGRFARLRNNKPNYNWHKEIL